MRGSRFLRQYKPIPKPTVQAKNTTTEKTSDSFLDTGNTHNPNSPDAILNMQSVHGNQAVMRQLAQRSPTIQRRTEPGYGGSVGGVVYHDPPPAQLSGRTWVAEFPTGVSTDDLVGDFKTNAENFLQALTDAGATYQINATYRPPQRAYLMHYAYAIARKGMNPTKVSAYKGEGESPNIDWVHRNDKGKVDRAASKAAAEEMVVAYDMAYTAALKSRHTEGHAMDIEINWDGDLSIKNAKGKTVVIKTTPRTGAGNKKLHAVGKTYGVTKHPTDRPHWSTDGR
jgi:hypothetical protein